MRDVINHSRCTGISFHFVSRGQGVNRFARLLIRSEVTFLMRRRGRLKQVGVDSDVK